MIAKGPGYTIHSSLRAGAQRTADWEPGALLADIRLESPLVLKDHAWTEWSVLADGSHSCAIVYGRFGAPFGERNVPVYGSLRAFESRHKQTVERGEGPLKKGFLLIS